jgi:hypothetical protein
MKTKIFIAGCVILAIGLAAFARAVTAPSREAGDCLAQLNGVRVGKTTEAELLSKPFFQNSPRRCSNDMCFYNLFASNEWPAKLHLAPSTDIGIIVQVQDGVVFHLWVYGMIQFKDSTASLTLDQMSSASCSLKPCIHRDFLDKTRYRPRTMSSVKVTFDGTSDIPDQMSTAVNVSCLYRLRGCSSVEELLPLAGRLANSEGSGSSSAK